MEEKKTNDVALAITISVPISEQQLEIVMDNLIHGDELYTLQSEYGHITSSIKDSLLKDGRYNLLKINSANLDTDALRWDCKCLVLALGANDEAKENEK